MKTILAVIALIASVRGIPYQSRIFQSKIIGGTVTEDNEFPFSVSFQRHGLVWGHTCGGVVYNEKFIITAAQCLDGVTNLANVRIAAGEWSFSETSGDEQIRGVVNYTVHEDFNIETFENDIALVEVNVPFDFGAGTVFPIALPNQEEDDFDGANVTTVGWGDTVIGGVTPDKPRKVSTVVLNDKDCDAAYGGDIVRSSMICAAVPEGGKGPCQGDLGGPLFIDDPRPVLVGLVSWSYRCALVGYPAVHTQVSYYADWIKDNINN